LVVRDRKHADFTSAASFARRLAESLLRAEIPADTLLNVNVPDLPEAAIKGFAVTRQGKRRYADAIVEKVDPRGRKYYWIGGESLDFVDSEGTDFNATTAGWISVTPLHLDLTNYVSLEKLKQLEVAWP
jgi:5'-nucleotidase